MHEHHNIFEDISGQDSFTWIKEARFHYLKRHLEHQMPVEIEESEH